jgi:hypothetical protein
MSEQAQVGSRLSSAAFAAVVAVLVVVVLFLLGCTYVAWHGAFNSDHLYPSAFCADVRLGRPLAGWYLPGAPYLFPDMALILPCQLLPGGLVGEFMGFVFAFFACLLGSVVWLGRAVGLTWRQAFVAAGCGVLLLVATHLGRDYESRGTHLASPGSHAGIIPVGLALVALAVRLLQRGPRPLPVALFLAAGALGAASDKLLVVQFLAPLAGALVLLACCRVVGLKPAAGIIALIGGVLVLSAGVRLLLESLGFRLLQIELIFGGVKLRDLRALMGQVWGGVQDQYLLAALMPVYVVASVFLVEAWLRRPAAGPPGAAAPDRRAVLVAGLTLALVPLVNLAALFATGLSHNSAVYRYVLPCYVFPLLLTGWVLGLLPRRGVRLGRVAFPALAVLVAGWRLAERGPELAAVRLEQPYPELAQALDRLVRERGPMRGLGEFWSSRQMQFLTREHVVVAPFDRYGQPFFHASQPGRFLADDPHDASVPPFRFVVVGKQLLFRDPGPEMVALLYGPPRERIPAGEHEIWLYDRLQSSPLDRFFRTRLAERLRAHDPGKGPASPAFLAQPKPNMTPVAGRGVIPLSAGEAFFVRFPGLLTGKVLDVGAGYEEVFDLEFYAGDRPRGRLRVPAVPITGSSSEYPGIQSRLLELPPGLRTEPWDRIFVRRRPGSTTIHLGHILVRDDGVPDTGVAPSCRVPRLRLEGEWLPTFASLAEDLLAASTPDPQASAGRVRQVPAGFAGVVTFTNFLNLPAGRYRLDFAIRADAKAVPEEIATLDAMSFSLGSLLATRSLRGSDFPGTGFVVQSLDLDLPEETDCVVFRLVSNGKAALALDYLDIIALPADASTGQ